MMMMKKKIIERFFNIIIPEPKKRIRRRILGDKINDKSSSSVPSDSSDNYIN